MFVGWMLISQYFGSLSCLGPLGILFLIHLQLQVDVCYSGHGGARSIYLSL